MKIATIVPSALRAGARARVITAALVAAVLAAGIGLAPTAASASSRTVAYGVPYGHAGSNFVDGRVRPTGRLLWTGDGSGWFVIHFWRTWRQFNARGSATIHVRDGQPGFHYRTEHSALHFYRVRVHNGHRYFTRLHFALAHKVAGVGSGTLKFCKHGEPAWYYSCA
jgi:hypothetical protein